VIYFWESTNCLLLCESAISSFSESRKALTNSLPIDQCIQVQIGEGKIHVSGVNSMGARGSGGL